MSHILDNPIWHALISGNKSLAHGNDYAKYFSKDVATFVGLPRFATENFQELYDMIPDSNTVATFSKDEIVVPQFWTLVNQFKILQMVYEGPALATEPDPGIILLDDRHIPEMIQLTRLTNPGPFNQRTIDFGKFLGIFNEGHLIAMAGQRLHADKYKEVSAVCTHPDHTGKGYAKQLILQQIRLMTEASCLPIINVKTDNYPAIRLYEKIGFKTRIEIVVTVFKKKL